MPGVKYVAPFFDGSGYAEASRNYALALHSKGYPITIAPVSFESTRPDLGEKGKILYSLMENKIDYDKIIVHTTPDLWNQFTHYEVNKKIIGFTVWETSKLHPLWTQCCNEVNEVWVPCDWNVQVFKDSGVTVPIIKMPHAIDVPDLDNIKDYDLQGIPDGSFVFYSIFQWQERKNPYALIASYLSAFSGVEDVYLVLKTYRNNQANDREEIRNILQDFRKFINLDHYPKLFLLVENLSNSDMLALHKAGDCFVLLQRSEGWGLCVDPKTKVLTSNGVEEMEKISNKDFVMSLDGKFHKVLAKKNRYVEAGLRMTFKSLQSDPLSLSKEHPIYCLSGVTKNGFKKRFSNLKAAELEKQMKWVPAQDVKEGDFVALPYPRLEKPLPKSLDVSLFLPKDRVQVSERKVFTKKGFSSTTRTEFSYQQLQKASGFSKHVLESAVRHIRENTAPKSGTTVSEAHSFLVNRGYEIANNTSMYRFVPLDSSVFYLFGWYLAEGSWDKNAIDISLSHKESYVAEILKKTFVEKFGIPEGSVRYYTNGNRIKFRVSSFMISELFRALFDHGAALKRIPEFLFLSGNYLRSMMEALFAGDGYDSGNDYSLTTKSSSLAYQSRAILMSMGILPSLHLSKKNECYVVRVGGAQYRFLQNKQAKRTCNHFVRTENFFLVRVSKIEEILYRGLMYDIQVEDGESFIGNGVALHNCHFEAAACGNPVITTGYGGQQEFLKEDNSYLIDYQLCPVTGMPWSPYYRGDQLWADADALQAMTTMRHVYNNRKEAKEKGLKARQFIEDNFTWDKIGDLMLSRLVKIDNGEAYE